MGPKKIKRSLYAKKGVPQGAKPEHVREAMLDLTKTLMDKMGQTYRWMASCTVAVEAGRWGGERRRLSRIKLLNMINECRSFLGQEIWEPEDGWTTHNLYYGYGAIHSYANATGKDPEAVMLVQFVNRLKGIQGADS